MIAFPFVELGISERAAAVRALASPCSRAHARDMGIVATFGALKGSGQTYCVGAGGCGQTDDGSQLVVTGIILMGAGAVTTVVGAIILGGNVRTKVGQVPLVMTPPAAGPDLVRRPIWYADRAPIPATPFTIPIVSSTF